MVNQAIMDSLDKGLRKSNVGSGALSLLTTRQESLGLLRLDKFVNLIIPRAVSYTHLRAHET